LHDVEKFLASPTSALHEYFADAKKRLGVMNLEQVKTQWTLAKKARITVFVVDGGAEG